MREAEPPETETSWLQLERLTDTHSSAEASRGRARKMPRRFRGLRGWSSEDWSEAEREGSRRARAQTDPVVVTRRGSRGRAERRRWWSEGATVDWL